MAEKLALFKETTPPSASFDENDIDITPMMNMFIILVTFLVSMAVFTHVAILDFSLPPNVGAGLDVEGHAEGEGHVATWIGLYGCRARR
jgi:hypothetical protein